MKSNGRTAGMLKEFEFDKARLESRSASEPRRAFADEAKMRIIRSAEFLFADQSIHTVAFREIGRHAGYENTNAVQYHFGNRDALIQAIFAWRVWRMEPARRALMQGFEAGGAKPGPVELLTALCAPVLDQTDDDGRHCYASVMSQYLVHLRPAGLRHAVDIRNDLNRETHRILGLLKRQLGRSEVDQDDWRVGVAYMTVMNALVQSDNENLHKTDQAKLRARFEDALAMAGAGLELVARKARTSLQDTP